MGDGKRQGFNFKLRISRVIPLFSLCRSKPIQFNSLPSSDPSFPGQHAPASRSSVTRTVSSALCKCSALHKNNTTDLDDLAWHVVAKVRRVHDLSPPRRKIYTSGCHETDVKMERGRNKKKKKKRIIAAGEARVKLRVSSSSSVVDTFALFEETEQLLITSRETSPSVATVMKRGHGNRSEMQRQRESVLGRGRFLAVVKRSEDPHGDFKRSMLEMILKNEMFHESELQQLLECFLSHNSKHHYPTILSAFSDVWETLFCKH